MAGVPTALIPVCRNCRAPGGAPNRVHQEVESPRQPQIHHRHPTVLPRPLRLTRSAEYRAVYANGQSRRGEALVCIVLALGDEPTRAGVVASRRVGGAVQRNRAKRRLRHALLDTWPSLPERGFHIVLVATPATGKVDYVQLLADLWRSLSELGVTLTATPAASKPDSDRDSGNLS